MAQRYMPPTKGSFIDIPFETLVQRADPDWARGKRQEIEYVMSNGRVFWYDPNVSGAYAPDDD